MNTANTLDGNLGKGKNLNVLIVDDEKAVHDVTELVLKSYEYQGYRLEFSNAYSAAQAMEILGEDKTFALILLDVIMETDEAGLDLVRYIRNELRDFMVRIILRTGQPGMVPQKKVMRDYEIDDYKEKSELTSERFDTAITASVRTFLSFRQLEERRLGIMRILDIVRQLEGTGIQSLFTSLILDHVNSVLNRGNSESMGALLFTDDDNYSVISATGTLASLGGSSINSLENSDDREKIQEAIHNNQPVMEKNRIIVPLMKWENQLYTIYLIDEDTFGDFEYHLLNLYTAQITSFLNNKSLTKEIFETQEEIINTLGEVIETRSGETGAHVRRVKEITRLLAESLGFDTTKKEILTSATPLHDIGKVGISDSILNKPGKLTDQEYVLMKTHADLGYKILKNSSRPILKLGAKICLEHHEWWNGNGYPNGLSGDEISLEARICSIADVLDALQSKRVYKDAIPLDDALNIIVEGRGTQFDPELVDLLLEHKEKVISIYKELT